ncbi:MULTISPECIES: hypothetical protein [Vibrio]|uniref:hypothetical protein n=1 Tax=Vibrio TaxID=662 RepID=UPI001123CC7C|nr:MULTISPECIES: hypothetical protein [Vibrio]MCS0444648.1 hypothetical protein [Vibrio diabolicus]
MNVTKIMSVTTFIHMLAGIVFSFYLSSHPNLELFKLANFIGLLLDIIGVLLLTNLVVSSTNIYRKFFDYIYAFLLFGVINVPIGMILGCVAWTFMGLPSPQLVLGFSASMVGIIGTPLFTIDYAAEIFQLKFYETVKSRIVFMGWFLVCIGLSMQLFGAAKDLFS